MIKIKKQDGYSLAELVVALPLSILVIVILTFAIANFATTYQEIQLYTQLQEELFNAIETMRYGYAKEGVTGSFYSPENEKEGLIGLLTAKEVTIGLTGKTITIKPINLNPGVPYYSQFFLDDKNHLRVSGQYGIKTYTNELVFPQTARKIGGEQQFKILDLYFEPQKVVNNNIYVLGIEIKARVRFREKLDSQSLEEDSQINTKTIEYKTSVYLANSGS